jgi:hypothetical protein
MDAEDRFLDFVRRLQNVVRNEGLKDAALYEYYLGSESTNKSCYIHEAYGDVDSFVSHMANIRALMGGADELFEVEALDICGPLTPELSTHFAELYGQKFAVYPNFVDCDFEAARAGCQTERSRLVAPHGHSNRHH